MANSNVSIKDMIWAIIQFAFYVILIITVVSVVTIIPEDEWVSANAPEILVKLFAFIRTVGRFVWNLIGR